MCLTMIDYNYRLCALFNSEEAKGDVEENSCSYLHAS